MPPVLVRVVPVGAHDGRELPEERHDSFRVVSGVALGFSGLVVLRRGGACGKELCHEVPAEPVHLVEERLLELRRAGDAVALDGARGRVDDGVDPRRPPQDDSRDVFFRVDSAERIASASTFARSASSLLAVAPPLTASRKAGSLSLGMRMVWLRPLAQYWRLW